MEKQQIFMTLKLLGVLFVDEAQRFQKECDCFLFNVHPTPTQPRPAISHVFLVIKLVLLFCWTES